jgi:uncharacterized protein (TIGR02145 family)
MRYRLIFPHFLLLVELICGSIFSPSCKKDEGSDVVLISSIYAGVNEICLDCVSDKGSGYGACCSTKHMPTVDDNVTWYHGRIGLYDYFASWAPCLIGLTPNTTYYIRAFVKKSGEIVYSNEHQVRTTIGSPFLTTVDVTSITSFTAICGGNISSDGGSNVIDRGVCWSINSEPDLNDSHSHDGSGIGLYSSSLIGLIGNKKYYVRAYATNSIGTSYGQEISFTSGPLVPTIEITTNPYPTSTTTAICGGKILHDNGSLVINRGVCWSISPNPTINDETTSNGTDIGSFTSNMTNLTANTEYYVRAYATNSAGTAYGDQKRLKTYSGIVTDIEGNIYYTITIGSQIWMAENLKTVKYNNNTELTNIKDNSSWALLSTPAYCWFDNDITKNKSLYGALYNWYAVNTGLLCPTGWRVPGKNDFETLINFLGGQAVAGGKMKATIIWLGNYSNNSSGFSALPGGHRNEEGMFPVLDLETKGFWWTSDKYENDEQKALQYNLYVLDSDVYTGANKKSEGMSVRCIKN